MEKILIKQIKITKLYQICLSIINKTLFTLRFKYLFVDSLKPKYLQFNF